jgi:hypothetical protein
MFLLLPLGVVPKGNKTGFWVASFTMMIVTAIEKQVNKKLFTARGPEPKSGTTAKSFTPPMATKARPPLVMLLHYPLMGALPHYPPPATVRYSLPLALKPEPEEVRSLAKIMLFKSGPISWPPDAEHLAVS